MDIIACILGSLWHNSCHVYRGRPQPQIAARDPVAASLSRGRQGQEEDPGESDRLAEAVDRRLPGPAEGGKVVAAEREAVSILRSLPHGHVAAALGTLRAIGLDRVLGPPGNRRRDLVIAMVVSRLIAPGSKLATARGLDPATATSSLGEVLGLRAVDEDELYGALDWLRQRQPAIEKSLARKHLADGVLVLYDVTSSYLEGRCCPLAKLGYNRDGKKGKLQIVYGLLCAADGCPVAVEVFDGDTADPKTLAA